MSSPSSSTGGVPLPFLFAMAFRAMNDHLHTRLTELGREPLRPAHGFAFRYLSDRPATAVELAAHLGVTKQAASKTVSELEEWGYLRREAHPTDKRAYVLVLTERGHEYVRLASELWGEAEQKLATVIGPERVAAIAEDLHAYLHEIYGDDSVPLRPVW